MRRANWVIAITATAAAIGVAAGAGTASAAGAQNVQCHSGDILAGVYKNVVVPRGNFCLLLGATVLGNVTANNGQRERAGQQRQRQRLGVRQHDRS